MEKHMTKTKQLFLIIGTVMGWFAVVFQLYLLITNRIASVNETLIRFFSFYTILTNILVALCFTVLLLKPVSRWGRFFSRPQTLTAIAVYITVVGIVYNTILRFIWAPQGLQQVVDELLHFVIPLFFVLYWVLFATKTGLKWKNVLTWIIYPLVYAVFVLFRGTSSGWYPYPFLDANALGYNKVLINVIGLFVAFLLISLLFVAISKRFGKVKER